MEEKGCGPGMGMEMMKKMMESQGGGMLPMVERWMQMCEQMTGTVIEVGRLAGFASPELRGLFDEWLKALESEIIEFLKEQGSCPPADLAAQLKLSEESVFFLIGKLVREGKLKITGISL